MRQSTRKDDVFKLRVRVTPRASRTEVAGSQDGVVRIRIAAAPIEGAANKELVRMLARVLGVPKSSVSITAGHSSRIKEITVVGADRFTLGKLIAGHM